MTLPPDIAAKCLELAATPPPPKPATRRKYNNVPTVVDGIKYDSKKEAKHGQMLEAMQRDGLISNLRRQVPYLIQINGVKVCKCVMDFVFTDSEGNTVVQDVKSAITRKNPVYRLKAKLMLAVHGITVCEV